MFNSVLSQKNINFRLLLCLFACILFFGFLLVPRVARAEQVVFAGGTTGEIHSDGSITGTGWIGDWTLGGDYEQYFEVHMPDGFTTTSAECLNAWHWAPSSGNYSFTATPVGGGWYNVTLWSASNDNMSSHQPDDYVINGHEMYLPTQNVGNFLWYAQYTRYGRLSITKQVENNAGVNNVFKFNVNIYRDAAKTDLYKSFTNVSVSQAGGTVDLGEDIPAGYHYVVDEVADAHFDLISISPKEGDIVSGETVNVVARNRGHGHFKLVKKSTV